MEAKIITIGDELLIGQVIDSNSAWIAQQLEHLNIKITEIRSISDDHDVIIGTLNEMLNQCDAIIITGGLGPTKDDVTKKAIADFLNVPLEFDQKSYEWLVHLLTQFKYEIKEHHKLQAHMPKGCTVIPNKMGTAQGMWMEKNGKIILSMPGVPYEMQYIMKNGALEKFGELNKDQQIFHRTVMTVGIGETRIEERISDAIEKFPHFIKVAYLPGLGRVRVRLSSLSGNGSLEELNKYTDQVTEILKDYVYGYDEQKLEEVVGEMLIEKDLTLGTAESCTGGYISHLITSIPGSSAYFNGSVVSYSNDVKMKSLNVGERTLVKFGAVSEETVIEMVKGAVDHLNVDLAIAASGIAGPDGGTPEKPVGTIWLACGNRDNVETVKLQLTKNRAKNIEYTAIVGLNMLRKFLIEP